MLFFQNFFKSKNWRLLSFPLYLSRALSLPLALCSLAVFLKANLFFHIFSAGKAFLSHSLCWQTLSFPISLTAKPFFRNFFESNDFFLLSFPLYLSLAISLPLALCSLALPKGTPFLSHSLCCQSVSFKFVCWQSFSFTCVSWQSFSFTFSLLAKVFFHIFLRWQTLYFLFC